jgi:hypothetical protein
MASKGSGGEPLDSEGRLILQAKGHVLLRDTVTYLSGIHTVYSAVRSLELLPRRLPAQIKLPPRTLHNFLELPNEDELVFSSGHFESPGVWEFIGKLSPLEFVLKLINDHHRRKIEMAKLPETLRKSKLENDIREMDLLQTQISLARDVGFTNEEIGDFLRERIVLPARQIQEAQDSGLISTAKVEPT